MKCYKCKQDKNESEFSLDKSANRGRHGYCKECKYKLAKDRKRWLDAHVRKKETERRRNNKIMAIAYKGGKCVDCGYDKPPAALCFHHMCEKTKEIDDLIKMSFNDKLKKELDKCILLCHNCHDIRHYGSWKGKRHKDA